MKKLEGNIGIDIGRVLMAPVTGGKQDTAFLSGTFERAMDTPPAPHAFDAVRQIVDAFDKRVWLVSKAGSTVQDKTWHWLRHWDFYGKTGMRPKQVRFCRERREKADHCEELALTHFVDDRLDVLRHLVGVDHRFLFGEQPSNQELPSWATPVLTWPDVLDALELGP